VLSRSVVLCWCCVGVVLGEVGRCALLCSASAVHKCAAPSWGAVAVDFSAANEEERNQKLDRED
jgi:hypothetical protein